jgi:hypothetical protein
MVSGGTPLPGRSLVKRLKTESALPQIEYFITYRNRYCGASCAEIAQNCQQICDFATTWRAP